MVGGEGARRRPVHCRGTRWCLRPNFRRLPALVAQAVDEEFDPHRHCDRLALHGSQPAERHLSPASVIGPVGPGDEATGRGPQGGTFADQPRNGRSQRRSEQGGRRHRDVIDRVRGRRCTSGATSAGVDRRYGSSPEAKINSSLHLGRTLARSAGPRSDDDGIARRERAALGRHLDHPAD